MKQITLIKVYGGLVVLTTSTMENYHQICNVLNLNDYTAVCMDIRHGATVELRKRPTNHSYVGGIGCKLDNHLRFYKQAAER